MSSGFPPESISFQIGADEWNVQNEEEIYKGGNSVEKDGMYHVIVESVTDEDTEDEGKLRSANVILEILQGTEPDQIEKKVYHRIYLAKWISNKDHTKGQEAVSKGSMKNIIRFAMAFGILDSADIGSDTIIPFHALVARQAIVEVKKEGDREGKDKDGNEKIFKGQFKIPFSNAWPLDHEAVAGIPKCSTGLAQQGLDDHGHGFENTSSASGVDDI